MSKDKQSSPYRVQVLDRALGILNSLGSECSGATLIEISKKHSLHKSTTLRLLTILEAHRLIEKRNGRYYLGLKLFILGSKAVAGFDLRQYSQPYLKQLVSETGETANLCVLDEGQVLYIEKVEASHTVRVPSIVGRRYPAHCGGAGKALLAFLPEEELAGFISKCSFEAYTPNTVATPAQLRSELQLVRERGFSLDNEEYEEGLKCIGAPVRDHTGQVIASISIAGPSSRLTEEKLPILAGSVVHTANMLSAELGFQGTKIYEGTALNLNRGSTAIYAGNKL